MKSLSNIFCAIGLIVLISGLISGRKGNYRLASLLCKVSIVFSIISIALSLQ